MKHNIQHIGILILFCASLEAATYYVSTNGNDANSCAMAKASGLTAKRHITGASGGASCLACGDTLIVQSGSYNEVVMNVLPAGKDSTHRTVFKCESKRGCTIPAVYIRDNVDYVDIQDFVIDANFQYVHAVTLIASPPYNEADFPNYVRIVGNEIKRSTGEQIYDGSGQGIEILNNYIHDGDDIQGGAASAIYGTSRFMIMRGNEVYKSGTLASQRISSGHQAHDNLFENNWVHECTCADGTNRTNGFILADTYNLTIRRNIIGPGCVSGISSTVGPTSTSRFDHNVIYGNTGTGVHFNQAGSTGNVLRNNIILNNGAAVNLCNGCVTETTNLKTGTPAAVFTNPNANDFTLRAGSPAIDAGTNIGLAFNGSAPDLGAYETGTTGLEANSRVKSSPAAFGFSQSRSGISMLFVAAGNYELSVHDVNGRSVWSQGGNASGLSRMYWSGKDRQGRALPLGVYVVSLNAASKIEKQKIFMRAW